MHKSLRGFTIVELLIVIVVIAVLASITIVAYRGIQDRAKTSAVSAAVNNITKKITLYKAEHDSYPASLAAAGIANDPNITYDYTGGSGYFCFSATKDSITQYGTTYSTSPDSGNCSAALSRWSTSSGTIYNTKLDQLEISPTTSGVSSSPNIPTNSAATAKITVQAFATQPSPNGTPNSLAYMGSNYYESDGVTPATNTSGHTGNGNATCTLTPNVWRTCTWTTPLGPSVSYVSFRLHSSPSTYTSDNIYRNPQISFP